jgi:hypothetical protein
MQSEPRHLSLRATLKGEIDDFLDHEVMQCNKTKDALVELVNEIASYKEEGQLLFPEIYFIDNLQKVFSVLPGIQYVEIGRGPKDSTTAKSALKKCAPLAKYGWAIYIHRKSELFEYGVFRSGTSIISVPVFDTLINYGDAALPVIMLHQTADNVVEVKGVHQSTLIVHFRAERDDVTPQYISLSKFITCIVEAVDPAYRDQAFTFFFAILSDVAKARHGALSAVISSRKKKIPNILSKGIILTKRINIVEMIRELVSKNDVISNIHVQSFGTLIEGMLLSDGITVFSADGCLLGYNVFLDNLDIKSGELILGGARRRAFKKLCDFLDKDIVGLLMISQDGKIEYKGK